MSDSVRPHRRKPTRLLCPWDSPGKNTGLGCHFLLQCMKVKSESEVTQSCLTLSDPMDCIPPGSSIHEISEARVLEWGAIVFSHSLLSSSMGFPRHHYWRGLPFPTPGDLSNPRYNPVSCKFLALQVDSLLLSDQGPQNRILLSHKKE